MASKMISMDLRWVDFYNREPEVLRLVKGGGLSRQHPHAYFPAKSSLMQSHDDSQGHGRSIYVHQLAKILDEERSTVAVDFQHVRNHSPVLGEAITNHFYRVEPYLRYVLGGSMSLSTCPIHTHTKQSELAPYHTNLRTNQPSSRPLRSPTSVLSLPFFFGAVMHCSSSAGNTFQTVRRTSGGASCCSCLFTT